LAPLTASATLSELKYEKKAMPSAITNAMATPMTPHPSRRSTATPTRTISSTNAARITKVRHLLRRISL